MQERPPFSDWLEKLQQESWNLELLVSGFAIFLLIQADAALETLAADLFSHYTSDGIVYTILVAFWFLVSAATSILIVGLILHIVLRGLWIGIIGLRSVQPEIKFDQFRYTKRFDAHLKKRLPPLDRLLIQLDRASSIIFAFAFLLVSMISSVAIWFISIALIVSAYNEVAEVINDGIWKDVLQYILTALIVVHLLASLLYVLDTLLIGALKRIRFFDIIYRPLYRYLNFITLSFIYRSVYYHLVSYIGVWRSRLLIATLIIFIILNPFLRFDQEIYFPDHSPANKTFAYYYDDMRPENTLIDNVAIASSVIQGNSLPLFIRYSPDYNATLDSLCAYTPSRSSGLTSGIVIKKTDKEASFNINNPRVTEAYPDSLLQCLSQFYQVHINDSLYDNQNYVYLEHPNQGEKGIYTVLDIRHLPFGYHQLRIDGQKWLPENDSLTTFTIAHVSFWKE